MFCQLLIENKSMNNDKAISELERILNWSESNYKIRKDIPDSLEVFVIPCIVLDKEIIERIAMLRKEDEKN